MTSVSALINLGFKENDALVYIATLQLGECHINQLVKKTGLHKQLIYNSAISLQKEGLLNIAETERQRLFIALPPDVLVRKSKDKLEQSQALVEDLKKISGSVKKAENIRIFKEHEGIRQYYLTIVEHMPANSVLKIIGIDSKRYFEIFSAGMDLFQAFEETRIGKRIKIELIIFGKQDNELKFNSGRRFLEIRILNDDIKSPNDVIIGSDQVGLLFYGDYPYLLELPGTDKVEGFSEYFKFFWDRAKKCYG